MLVAAWGAWRQLSDGGELEAIGGDLAARGADVEAEAVDLEEDAARGADVEAEAVDLEEDAGISLGEVAARLDGGVVQVAI